MKKTLPAELRSAINKAAHAAGLKHGEQLKRQLLTDAEAMLSEGKSTAEIAAYLAPHTTTIRKTPHAE